MSNNTQTQELRALLAKATAGPWSATHMMTRSTIQGPSGRIGMVWRKTHQSEDSADLIVDGINALPALLDHIERLEAALREWSEQPCETIGLEDMEPGCCRACRARLTLEQQQ